VTAETTRVVILVENLPVPFDRRPWREATTLSTAGYDVSVVCPKASGFEEEEIVLDGVRILRHSMPPEQSNPSGYIREYAAALRAEWRLLLKISREGRIDIIHMCNPPDLLFIVALPFKFFQGTRVVFDHHDLSPELWEAKYGKRGFFYWCLRVAERLTFRTADVVISTNESYRAVALGRGGHKADSVFIVRSSPDGSKFKAVAPVERYRNGRSYLVGYVGLIGTQEGLDQLMMAIGHIVHTRGRDDVAFCVIGSGPALESTRDLAVELHIDDFLEFTGRVPDAELVERLSTCDVCVNPDPKTPFNDKSTMTKILEYMALGKPIVQFDLVEDRRSAGPASLYADAGDVEGFGDSILALLDNEQERSLMAEAGLSRFRDELEWRHQTVALYGAYETAMRRTRRSARLESAASE
jgi:glycosyltransferase involved in cell wall biosynthesis